MRLRTAPAGRAFTLVEIMIALVIFSTVIAAIYAVWSSILRGTRLGLEAAARVQRERVTVRVLEEAFRSIQFFQENARYYAFEADTSGDFAAVSFVSRLPQSFPRSGHFDDQALRRLTFTVEPRASSRSVLVLRQRPILFESSVDEEENPLELARDVSEFTVEFWGANSREWQPDWLYTNQLPRMIRYSLAFGGGATKPAPDVVANVVEVTTAAIPSAMQRGALQPGAPPPGVAPGAAPGAGTVNPGGSPPPGPGQPPPK